MLPSPSGRRLTSLDALRGVATELVQFLTSLEHALGIRQDLRGSRRLHSQDLLLASGAVRGGFKSVVEREVVVHGSIIDHTPVAESYPPRHTGGMVRDEPWIKQASEGLLGQWHMPAGEGSGFILAACDSRFETDVRLDRRDVGRIPASERCPVCQDVYRAREAS